MPPGLPADHALQLRELLTARGAEPQASLYHSGLLSPCSLTLKVCSALHMHYLSFPPHPKVNITVLREGRSQFTGQRSQARRLWGQALTAEPISSPSGVLVLSQGAWAGEASPQTAHCPSQLAGAEPKHCSHQTENRRCCSFPKPQKIIKFS